MKSRHGGDQEMSDLFLFFFLPSVTSNHPSPPLGQLKAPCVYPTGVVQGVSDEVDDEL